MKEHIASGGEERGKKVINDEVKAEYKAEMARKKSFFERLKFWFTMHQESKRRVKKQFPKDGLYLAANRY